MQTEMILTAPDPKATKFHGKTFDAKEDEDRLQGQLLRIYETLKGGQSLTAEQLSEYADVSLQSLRNRVSDLRVYHGFIIDVERRSGGTFIYRMVGKMPPEEHAQFCRDLAAKRAARAGDKRLFGDMMHRIFAYANDGTEESLDLCFDAFQLWMNDLADKVKKDRA